MVLIAAVALLVSPVSWTHHWVWVVPGLIWGVGRALHRGSRVAAGGVLLVGAVFLLGPQWLLPTGGNAELHWTVGQFVMGDAYVEIAFLVVVVAGLLSFRTSPTPGWPDGDGNAAPQVTVARR
ncbi:MAG: hypothetical protein HIU86_10245 [Acidobacteria bacterium]|nr:hypothetical protein [Acidobacteriota bacterium]